MFIMVHTSMHDAEDSSAGSRTEEAKSMRSRPPGSGKRDQERGLESELRVVEACRLPTRPPWMTRVRRATRIEDHSGIDVVVESDVGTLLIQVKSSNLGKKHFRPRAFLGIALVVVRPGDTPEALLKKVVGELEPVRALRLQARRNWRARLVERPSPPPPARARPAKSTRAAAPPAVPRPAEASEEPSPARAPGVHWIELRDAVLAVLLRHGPGRAHTEAELRPTLKAASLDELLARHPSSFVRREDGTVQAAIGLADAYGLRLARCWEEASARYERALPASGSSSSLRCASECTMCSRPLSASRCSATPSTCGALTPSGASRT
jgi:hypothetical protein